MRGAIPPGFSYFCVGFGIGSGYATVIENTDEWPADFGRDVLEGILEHEDAGGHTALVLAAMEGRASLLVALLNGVQ